MLHWDWDLLYGGGGGSMVSSLYRFSNLADSFIQSDLQMRTMEVYVCVFCFFANMIYSNRIVSSVFYYL